MSNHWEETKCANPGGRHKKYLILSSKTSSLKIFTAKFSHNEFITLTKIILHHGQTIQNMTMNV